MEFKEWFKKTGPGFGHMWETYLDELIAEGCIVDHTDIELYMMIAFEAGKKTVKEGMYDAYE